MFDLNNKKQFYAGIYLLGALMAWLLYMHIFINEPLIIRATSARAMHDAVTASEFIGEDFPTTNITQLYARWLFFELLTGNFPVEFINFEPADVAVYVRETTKSEQYNAPAILTIGGQITALAIFTIWARSVGPRFRPDQMSTLTGKDLLPMLVAGLILAITIMH